MNKRGECHVNERRAGFDAHSCALPDGTEVIASVAAQLVLTEHLAPTLATVTRDRPQLR